MPIAEEGQNQRHDGVDRPGVQPQWKKVRRMACLAASTLSGVPTGGEIVHHRFCHAEEHQADAHPR